MRKRRRLTLSAGFALLAFALASCTAQRPRGGYYTPANWRTPISKSGAPVSRAEPAPASTGASQGRNYVAKGVASWYGPNFHGKQTASGEVYNQNAMTAAHKYLPMHTLVRVTNLKNNKQAVVRINDRGPYAKGRILDASYALAQRLGFRKEGTAPVKLEVVNYPNHFDNRYGLAAYKQSVVQFGAFNNKKAAAKMKQSLAARYKSLPLIIDNPRHKKAFYVLAGPFNNKSDAKRISGSMRRDGHPNIVRSFRK